MFDRTEVSGCEKDIPQGRMRTSTHVNHHGSQVCPLEEQRRAKKIPRRSEYANPNVFWLVTEMRERRFKPLFLRPLKSSSFFVLYKEEKKKGPISCCLNQDDLLHLSPPSHQPNFTHLVSSVLKPQFCSHTLWQLVAASCLTFPWFPVVVPSQNYLAFCLFRACFLSAQFSSLLPVCGLQLGPASARRWRCFWAIWQSYVPKWGSPGVV